MRNVPWQMKMWAGEFGQQYTERNPKTLDERNTLHKRDFGLTRIELNQKFLKDIDRSIRILEVGVNVGTQLMCLQAMDFTQLYGIDVQRYALTLSLSRTTNIHLIQGTIFNIPFSDASFDLVFTSGVLIHIHPDNIEDALAEMYRCTRRYIWGYEYYSDTYEEIFYQEKEKLCWKTDFARLYLNKFSDLILVKERKLTYIAENNKNVDSMFLLEKPL